MRYSLLNYLACPETHSPLVAIVTSEKAGSVAHVPLSACDRVNAPGSVVGPVPSACPDTPMARALRAHAGPAGDPARVRDVRIEEGLLVAPDTGRWYPIRGFIPEVLPDHLRNLTADRAFLATLAPSLPTDLAQLLTAVPFEHAGRRQDGGISHKNAEMTIVEKVLDTPHFFGPGYIAPFNPGAPDHTIHLIRMFGFVMPLLGNGTRKVVLDSGCGYSWTTEWMWKCGLEPIGIDISRVYLEIAAARLGDGLPHVLVADTEFLPLGDGAIEAVLGFDAFHHIPDRPRAMREFHRTMRHDGVIVLAEPSTAHDTTPAVMEVAAKYGTIEKGMDLIDVRNYVAGSGLEDPVQHYILDVPHAAIGTAVDQQTLATWSFNPANLFTIRKP